MVEAGHGRRSTRPVPDRQAGRERTGAAPTATRQDRAAIRGALAALRASARGLSGHPIPFDLGWDTDPGGNPAVVAAVRDLAALEDALSLERDEVGGVLERLRLECWGGGAFPCAVVTNALGAGEWSKLLPLDASPSWVLDWDLCRRVGARGDDPWDVACRGPRRIGDFYDGKDAIDRGCHLAIDLLAGFGLRTRESCEGHPGGAYLGLREGTFDGPVGRAVAASGWTLDRDGTVARMDPVADGDVATRDARWRALCAALVAASAGDRRP